MSSAASSSNITVSDDPGVTLFKIGHFREIGTKVDGLHLTRWFSISRLMFVLKHFYPLRNFFSVMSVVNYRTQHQISRTVSVFRKVDNSHSLTLLGPQPCQKHKAEANPKNMLRNCLTYLATPRPLLFSFFPPCARNEMSACCYSVWSPQHRLAVAWGPAAMQTANQHAFTKQEAPDSS